MIINIEKCAVGVEEVTIHNIHQDMHKEYFLHLMLPVPGGELKYKVRLDKAQYDSLMFANRLITQK